jgi:L-ascorbate metabolism protein UlaG (beta-lactamase superfamily)
MKFHYYGHSCFTITANDKIFLFDPFITGNPKIENMDVNSINCDYILLSHAHADHIGDLESIAKRTDAKVICAWEIHEWLNNKGIENTHPMNTGGGWDFGDFKVKCVVAQHSSGLPDGSYGGNPMGFLVTMNERTIYYAGDTALTLDMQLIPTWATIEYAILPIGDNFTMDATDAARAAEMVETKKVIGVHYDTFGFIEIDHTEVKEIFSKKGIELILLDIDSELAL